MVLKLEFVPLGNVDPIALRTTVFNTIKAMITAGTLLQGTDTGVIQDFKTTYED